MLPHGPLELAAFALALALLPATPAAARCASRHIARRRRRLPRAAGRSPPLLETFVAPMSGARVLLLVAARGRRARASARCSAPRLLDHARRARRPTRTDAARPPAPDSRARARRERRRRRASRPAPADRAPAATRGRGPRRIGPRRACSGSRCRLLIALELAAGALALGGARSALVVAARARPPARASTRCYELHLSPHDEAKPQDLEDMIEAIANIVRAFPDRARPQRPAVRRARAAPRRRPVRRDGVVDLPCAASRASARRARRRDQRRLPRRPPRPPATASRPQPAPGDAAAMPGHVMRFRKERSFVYPLVAAGDELASPPLEAIAHAQVALGAPSVVRFQLTPAPGVLRGARRAGSTAATRTGSSRQERWGLPEGGLTSTLNRAEMTNAERTQNRSLFWLEVVVAADTRETCKQLAAAVQARRGENRLHRRWMLVRQNLYRRRFADRHPAAAALAARAGLRRRGRAPARAALRAHEGRPVRRARHPAHPDAARDPARRRPDVPTPPIADAPHAAAAPTARA